MPASSKNKLDIQRENRKKLGEWEERIKEMGHDDEKRGIKAVEEVQKEDDKKQEEVKVQNLDKLTRAREKFTDEEYKTALCGWANVCLHGIKLPKGFLIHAMPSKKGVIIWIKDKKNAWYARGIEPSFTPQFDMRAVEDKIMDAIDFADILAKPAPTKNGQSS